MNPWNIQYWLDVQLPRMERNNEQITPAVMFSILQSIQNTIQAEKLNNPPATKEEL